MGFQEDLKESLDDIFEFADTTVTYCPTGGQEKVIKILRGLDEGDEYQGADDLGMTDVVGIQVSDIAEVKQYDTIKITTATLWEVLYAMLDKSRLMWIAKISIKEKNCSP